MDVLDWINHLVFQSNKAKFFCKDIEIEEIIYIALTTPLRYFASIHPVDKESEGARTIFWKIDGASTFYESVVESFREEIRGLADQGLVDDELFAFSANVDCYKFFSEIPKALLARICGGSALESLQQWDLRRRWCSHFTWSSVIEIDL